MLYNKKVYAYSTLNFHSILNVYTITIGTNSVDSTADSTIPFVTSSIKPEGHMLIIISSTAATSFLIILGALVTATIVCARFYLCKNQPTEQGQ